MKSIKKIVIIVFTVLPIMITMAPSIFAVTLIVGRSSGTPGDTIQIPITVDDPVGIASAAFTIVYDADHLDLIEIQSYFFDTFANQWSSLNPPPDPYPPGEVTINFITYNQPLTNNYIAGTGMMISAGRCTPETNSSNTTLFTLSFTLKSLGLGAIHPISIISTNLGHTDAGYDSQGVTVPMLMGADATKEVIDPAAYPILLDPLAPQEPIGSTFPGSITIEIDSDGDGLLDHEESLLGTDPNDEDSDNDLMSDGWENANGLQPTEDDSLFDPDEDGYCNLREWLSGTSPKVEDIPLCLADFDIDFDSDGEDLGICIEEYDRTDCSEISVCLCDIDGDGDVDEIDLFLLSEDFGRIDVP